MICNQSVIYTNIFTPWRGVSIRNETHLFIGICFSHFSHQMCARNTRTWAIKCLRSPEFVIFRIEIIEKLIFIHFKFSSIPRSHCHRGAGAGAAAGAGTGLARVNEFELFKSI